MEPTTNGQLLRHNTTAVIILNSVHVECSFYFFTNSITYNSIQSDSIATAIIAASYGAKAILVDVGIFATSDMSRYNNIIVFQW